MTYTKTPCTANMNLSTLDARYCLLTWAQFKLTRKFLVMSVTVLFIMILEDNLINLPACTAPRLCSFFFSGGEEASVDCACRKNIDVLKGRDASQHIEAPPNLASRMRLQIKGNLVLRLSYNGWFGFVFFGPCRVKSIGLIKSRASMA